MMTLEVRRFSEKPRQKIRNGINRSGTLGTWKFTACHFRRKRDSQADPQHTLDIATAASFRTWRGSHAVVARGPAIFI